MLLYIFVFAHLLERTGICEFTLSPTLGRDGNQARATVQLEAALTVAKLAVPVERNARGRRNGRQLAVGAAFRSLVSQWLCFREMEEECVRVLGWFIARVPAPQRCRPAHERAEEISVEADILHSTSVTVRLADSTSLPQLGGTWSHRSPRGSLVQFQSLAPG